MDSGKPRATATPSNYDASSPREIILQIGPARRSCAGDDCGPLNSEFRLPRHSIIITGGGPNIC